MKAWAYTTRWMFERRMPPEKMASASPMLQIAWPGSGYRAECCQYAIEATADRNHSYLDVHPLVRFRGEDLQPAETVVQERLLGRHEQISVPVRSLADQTTHQ